MFQHRNNSRKPGSEFIGRFRQSFGGVITRRNSDGAQPTQSYNQDDTDLRPGRKSTFSPDLDLGDNSIPGPDFSHSSRDLGLMPLSMLASQHPGCYTPRSNGIGAILHNQAGNLHSPSLDFSSTPLSRMNAVANFQPGFDQFDTQYIASQMTQSIPDIQQSTNAPSTYLPNDFTYQDWDHGVTDNFEVDPAFDMFSFEPTANLTTNPAALTTEVPPHEAIHNDQSYTQRERFRYHVALRTSTAMVKSADEIPMSYLNKGQVYGLMVMDLTPPVITPEKLRYRTFVRISFDDEEQRSNPALYWRLWKEGRGTNEAQQRGSNLLAVEFAAENKNFRHMQLEQVSIDGFCVTWNVERAESTKGCTIPLRFNFLSTDFSHSKGVKGIPVRLCAKTELVSLESTDSQRDSEVCYCKVKLYRDHGAERKEANDLQHVRKSIERLEQQIKDAELGGRIGKRRRANNTSTDIRDSKELEYGHVGSGVRDGSMVDDLKKKLAISQGMLSSTRTVTILALRGDQEDDPDNYPVQLAGDQKAAECDDLKNLPPQPTAEPPTKPTACFFIRPSNEAREVFRAIYLTERTVKDLTKKICEKYHIDQSNIVRLLRIINDDLKIIVDDDLVRELPEGQVMIADICETTSVVDGEDLLKEIRLKY